MLLPCGISLFSGVEFVCCPKHFKGNFPFPCVLTYKLLSVPESVKPKKPVELAILKKEQDVFSEALDDSDDDSDEDDSNDDLDDVADDTELSDDPSIDDEDDDEEDDDGRQLPNHLRVQSLREFFLDYDDSDWDTTSQSTTLGMKVPTTSATTTTTTTSTTTTEKPTTEATPDPYFTHFDPRNEHNSYKEAQVRTVWTA